jgi:hypothetical protein
LKIHHDLRMGPVCPESSSGSIINRVTGESERVTGAGESYAGMLVKPGEGFGTDVKSAFQGIVGIH